MSAIETQNILAAKIRRGIAQGDYKSGRELVDAAVAGGDIQAFVQFVLRLRANRDTRRTWHTLCVERPLSPRWVSVFEQVAFNIYRAMRVQVVPAAERVEEEGLVMSRAQRRVLAPAGMAQPRAPPLAEMASRRALALWDSIRNKGVGLWIDNCYRRRYGLTAMRSNLSLDVTAVALVRLQYPGSCWGYRTMTLLGQQMPHAIAGILRELDYFNRRINNCIDGTMQREWVRAPLDLVRPAARAAPWLPVTLSEFRVGDHSELLHLLQSLLPLQQHVGRTVPLCVDMKIHAAIARFLYGLSYQEWNVHHFLRRLQVVYGVWHPYKYCCMVVYRQFHPLLALLEKPDLSIGAEAPVGRHLGYMERTFLGLLLAGQGRIKNMVTDARTRLAALPHPTPVDRLTFNKVVALHNLLYVYVPAVFTLGHQVRHCTWEGHEVGTGDEAKAVLQLSLTVLICLLGVEAAKKNEYVRTLCMALCMWTSWHSAVPAHVHVEESCEALIGRLGRACAKHTGVTDLDGTTDLFLTLRDVTKERRIRGQVSAKAVEHYEQSIVNFLRGASGSQPFMEWPGTGKGKKCTAVAPWPQDWRSTVRHRLTVSEGDLNTVFAWGMKQQTGRTPVNNRVKDFLRDNVPKRPAGQAAADRRAARLLGHRVA